MKTNQSAALIYKPTGITVYLAGGEASDFNRHAGKTVRVSKQPNSFYTFCVSPDDLIEFIVRPVDRCGYIDQGIAIGDCDDFSMALAALLATQGISTKFCTVAADERAPDQFSHVYCVAYLDGERSPLDASHGKRLGWGLGWEVPNRWGKREEWSTGGGCPLITLAVIGAAAYFGWKALKAA